MVSSRSAHHLSAYLLVIPFALLRLRFQKEPKLSRARQIPEWEEYDSEIARFARRLADEGKIKSRAIAADSDVLATVGNARSEDAPRPSEGSDVVVEAEGGSEAAREEVAAEESHPHDEL